MKILLANKFYYRRGGDCIYMLNLEQLLKAHGHEVAVFAQQFPENIETPWSKYFPSQMTGLKAFKRPFGDGETKRKFTQLLDDFKPDVVHLNNIHTQLSPVIAENAHEKGIKVVWTLHDYKLLCPRYDCLRNGENCELCFTDRTDGAHEGDILSHTDLTDQTDGAHGQNIKGLTDFTEDTDGAHGGDDLSHTDLTDQTDGVHGNNLGGLTDFTNDTDNKSARSVESVRKLKKNCLKYSCMKGGKIGSFIGYREAVKWNREKLESYTDVFVCPSRFMADKMKEGGFDSKKMVTLCNFIDAKKCEKDDYSRGEYYCYIGRLSHEKGTNTLIEAANQLPFKLVVIGNGPLEEELKAKANKNIEFVGHKDWPEIKELVGHARFSVIPSEWYENNPLSVIEAQCLGTPVLGARIGGIPELIGEGKTGMTFTSKDVLDLKDKIAKMWSASFDNEKIAKEAIKRYDAEEYYRQIMEIYAH